MSAAGVKSGNGCIADTPIVVVGACFVDYVAYVDHLPQVGESLRCRSFSKGFGGKGSNQAVCAGRLGASVSMVGAVGTDGDGADYIANFQRNGVQVSNVYRMENTSTGLAMIFVDSTTSHNEIVFSPNATGALTVDYLRKQSDNYNNFFGPKCRYIILQNEIPVETTLDVLKEAHTRGIYTVFNAAPAPSADEVAVVKPFLSYVSLFCVNEVEASMITGIDVKDTQSAILATEEMQKLGAHSVVTTLGGNGYVIGEKGKPPRHLPSITVKAVDSTGAGDCFVGAMVFYLSMGKSLEESCKRANMIAAISVQRPGTQSSYPTLDELPAEVKECKI
ncbi:ribokinase, putative [Trypanosoma brucei brucei TREU927]|uniref:Ribokinase n=1 Tax=Trypanosoma brucei brucei (strain 927/4 GUTat10.1) TaxID=185431 RepID=Q387E8_TRYB2|nr:ribokinase, putative [Trypanosoma brucei brucei TREU927]EAN79083.1 ribokinase, putative [Trypanosoma brucei brucei TREU927]